MPDEKINDNDIEYVEKAFDKISNIVEKLGQQKEQEGVLKPYFRAFVKKMLENFSSAKMIMFFFPLFTSAWFLLKLFQMYEVAIEVTDPATSQLILEFFKMAMDGFTSWCTFTVSLGGSILVVREVFKVQKLRALNDETKKTNKDIDKVQV